MGKHLLPNRPVKPLAGRIVSILLVLLFVVGLGAFRGEGNIASASADPLSDALIQLPSVPADDRADAFLNVVPQLENFLRTSASMNTATPTDQRYPGVRFLRTSDPNIRIVTLDGGSLVGSANRAYSWIQWVTTSTPRIQQIARGADKAVDATIVMAAGEKQLAIAVQTLQSPWIRLISGYRLVTSTQSWSMIPGFFSGITLGPRTPVGGGGGLAPGRTRDPSGAPFSLTTPVGSTSVWSSPNSVAIVSKGPEGGEMIFQPNTIRVCTPRRDTCSFYMWDGSQWNVAPPNAY